MLVVVRLGFCRATLRFFSGALPLHPTPSTEVVQVGLVPTQSSQHTTHTIISIIVVGIAIVVIVSTLIIIY